MLEPIDTIVTMVAWAFLTLLGSGAIWVVLSSSKDRKEEVKAGVVSFSKIAMLVVGAAVIYHMPDSYLSSLTSILDKNPWLLKLTVIPIYFAAALLTSRFMRRVWKS